MSLPVPAALLAACLLWAISFIATKVALEEGVPPLTVVALRLVIAALCFAPILVRRRAQIFAGGPARWRQLLVLSLIGVSLHHGTQTVGLSHTSASNASLWAMTCPISIALIAAVFLRERIGVRKAGGIVLAVAGALLVLGPDVLRGVDLRGHLLGDGLVFVSLFLWAAFTVYGKRLSAELGPLELIAAATAVGAACMLPVGAWEVWRLGFDPTRIGIEAWGAIGFLGFGCGFLANLLYFLALRRTETQKAGVYLYTIPPMTYAASWLALDERIGPGLIAGSLLVAAGVWLTGKG
ncbi:MAG TPA: DMT family transporter [Planctomycetota bacterium]|nr:DMT family transporter [Planctomycetota bacterium]